LSDAFDYFLVLRPWLFLHICGYRQEAEAFSLIDVGRK